MAICALVDEQQISSTNGSEICINCFKRVSLDVGFLIMYWSK